MKILIVDDSEQVRAFLTEIFRVKGFQVIEASNGLEALDIYNKTKTELILSDIEMPIMNGIELAEAIYKNHKKRITLMTATKKEFWPEEFHNALGVKEIIQKEDFRSKLIEIINKQVSYSIEH